MLELLKEIFEKGTIEIDDSGNRTRLHSYTVADQGLFIQKIFDEVLPGKTLEIGLAYGISTMFILEKHKEHKSNDGVHLVIEPIPWGNTALHNIKKAGLDKYVQIINKYSDEVLPELYWQKYRIQFAYVDTTKLFDTVLTDFYFIDRILDINGVVIIDDCDTSGINLVTRFIESLDNYEIVGRFGKSQFSWNRNLYRKFIEIILLTLPFKQRIFRNFSFKTDQQLGLDYRCIAFKKIAAEKRSWDSNQII